MKTPKTPSLRNAVEMSELHQRFEALPHTRRCQLKVGDSAKICAVFGESEGITGERFWVIITAVEAETGRYQGMVNNCLIHSASHGLYFRDLVAFEHRHIYDVVLQAEAAAMNRQAREEKAMPGFKNETLKAYDDNQL